MTKYIHLCVLIQLISTSSGQDVPVVCYEPREGAGEEECSPTTQLSSAQSYADCCAQSGAASTHTYLLDQHAQCASCGPVLDETLFFPEVATLDTSTIFINWGLHADSIPASRYVLSIGLQSEGEGGLTLVPVLVPDPSNPPSRHQFSPVTHGMVYSIAIRAVDATNTSSPVTSVVWRVGEDILPSFTDFSASGISSSGTVTVSWVVASPGLRPIRHISVQWVAQSAVEPGADLSDPTSRAYPLANVATIEYDIHDQTQGSVITRTIALRDPEVEETYFVAVTGTNVLGSKTTLFQFTAEDEETPPEQVPLGNSAERHATTYMALSATLFLVTALQSLAIFTL